MAVRGWCYGYQLRERRDEGKESHSCIGMVLGVPVPFHGSAKVERFPMGSTTCFSRSREALISRCCTRTIVNQLTSLPVIQYFNRRNGHRSLRLMMLWDRNEDSATSGTGQRNARKALRDMFHPQLGMHELDGSIYLPITARDRAKMPRKWPSTMLE